MYEMTKNLFDTALVKKPTQERSDRRHRKEDRRDDTIKERKDEKEYLKLDSMYKNKYIVPKPITKTKNSHNARNELYSEKLFKNINSDGIKKKTAKDALLLPLIKSEM
jgi:hypothetical protein